MQRSCALTRPWLTRPCTGGGGLGLGPGPRLGLLRRRPLRHDDAGDHGRRHLLTLAIESSCDDTCVALLEKRGKGRARLLFNGKITSDQRRFGGIHPATAALAHGECLADLVAEALRFLPDVDGGGGGGGVAVDTGSSASSPPPGRRKLLPDFVSVTRGPGMGACLATGLNTAKGLAAAWQVPLVAVNHMQAHALTPRLVSAMENEAADPQGQRPKQEGEEEEEEEVGGRTDYPRITPAFPFLSLLVSGGHTVLVLSRGLCDHRILAQAANIAVGDMIDKCARAILPPDLLAEQAEDVMYGRLLERFAFPAAGASGNSGGGDGRDYDYDYAPPRRRADELAEFDSGHGWRLSPALQGSRAMAYDFSGLNGAVQAIMQEHGGGTATPDGMSVEERRVLARQTMRFAFEHLASRVIFALSGRGTGTRKPALATTASAVPHPGRGGGDDDPLGHARGTRTETETEGPEKVAKNHDDDDDDDDMARVRTLVVSGGVASNRFLRHVLRSVLDARGFGHVGIVAPPPALCTDNAAMIAWAGAEMYEAGWASRLSVLPLRRWAVDPAAEGGGILGTDGWVRIGEDLGSRV